MCGYDFGFECLDALFSYLDCENAFPQDGFCEQPGPQDCFCNFIDAQDHVYESFCFGEFCDCIVDGQYKGSCLQSPEVAAMCDPFAGCCAALSYTTSPP